MIHLRLSDAYDIAYYTDKFKIHNLYLGYIKGQGYIFINEINDKAYFTAITSNKEPSDLNKNWNNPDYENEKWTGEPKEIATIYNELDKILKKYIAEQLNGIKGDYKKKIVEGVFVEIVSELLESLDYKKSFVYANTIKNEQIKDLALNPVNKFNYYLELEPKKIKDLKEEKDRIYNKITEHLEKAVNIYNNEKGVKPYHLIGTETETYEEIIDEKKFIKILNEIVSDAFSNPLLNLVYGNGKSKTNTIKAIDYVTNEFNIKGAIKNNKETIYYYDNELNYFEELTEVRLKNLISQGLNIKLLKSDYDTIYKSIQSTDKRHDNILVFKNMLFDMDTMQELKSPYNRSDYLAPALIGFDNENDSITLLDFNKNFDYIEIQDTDPNPAEITFVEKTLRQILIPKDDPKDLSMFHDFLQRLGSCILGQNKFKTITLYYGDGNNGKGVLKLLFELIFNRGAYSITPKTFEDNFSMESFINRKAILIDELEKNSFKNLIDVLKRISSPLAKTEARKIYSSENIIINYYANLFIFSNVIELNIPLSETALFNRLDFLKLPNTFVSEKELNTKPNSYPVDRDTEEKIKNDVEGLSWLITASIKAFQKMQDSKKEYKLKQTASETMDILLKTDHLTKFISQFTEKDTNLVGSECVSNDELLQQYKQYLEINGATTTESDAVLRRRIGTTLKQVYDIQGSITKSEIYHTRANGGASYKIRLKSFDELEKEFKQVYIINEDAGANELEILGFSNDNQIVYNKIQNGVNTINLLNKALPELNIYEIIKKLLNMNLIIKKTETNITESN